MTEKRTFETLEDAVNSFFHYEDGPPRFFTVDDDDFDEVDDELGVVLPESYREFCRRWGHDLYMGEEGLLYGYDCFRRDYKGFPAYAIPILETVKHELYCFDSRNPQPDGELPIISLKLGNDFRITSISMPIMTGFEKWLINYANVHHADTEEFIYPPLKGRRDQIWDFDEAIDVLIDSLSCDETRNARFLVIDTEVWEDVERRLDFSLPSSFKDFLREDLEDLPTASLLSENHTMQREWDFPDYLIAFFKDDWDGAFCFDTRRKDAGGEYLIVFVEDVALPVSDLVDLETVEYSFRRWLLGYANKLVPEEAVETEKDEPSISCTYGCFSCLTKLFLISLVILGGIKLVELIRGWL